MGFVKIKCETRVDESGCISPVFKIGAMYTSGFLKYFHRFAGKRVKITIEILED